MENETRLKVFVAVATAGSITKAADILAISQPAVSRHIRLLEAETGGKLFRRHGRGVALTDNGQKLYNVASSALDRIDAVIGQLQLSAKSVSGQLRVASVHTANAYFIMPLIQQITEEYPALSIQCLERSSLEVGVLVETGLADIGLAYDSIISAEGLHVERLHDETMQLIHSSHDEDQLTQHLNEQGYIELDRSFPFIAPPAGYALRQMMNARLGTDITYTIQSETITLMLEAVRSGLGVCILPQTLPDRLVEGQGLLRKTIAPPKISRTLVAITRPGSINTPAVSRMLTLLTQASKAFKP